MPSLGIQSRSPKGTFGSVINSTIREENPHIIPHLRGAPNPPAVIVIERRCENIPIE